MTAKTDTFVPKQNEPLIRHTMQAIADDLEAWNQSLYVFDDEDGKRTFCFAGRALVLQGYAVTRFRGRLLFCDPYDVSNVVDNTTEEAAAELGFTFAQARDIFNWMPSFPSPGAPDTTKEEQFAAFAEHVLAVTGIDCR